MPRRVRVPAPDELFRPTAVPDPPDDDAPGAPRTAAARPGRPVELVEDEPASRRTPSGRVRHDEKMTVYVTAEELLDLEHARLGLRRDHRLAVDRGRLVRAAIALALADLDAHGADSDLVTRLREG